MILTTVVDPPISPYTWLSSDNWTNPNLFISPHSPDFLTISPLLFVSRCPWSWLQSWTPLYPRIPGWPPLFSSSSSRWPSRDMKTGWGKGSRKKDGLNLHSPRAYIMAIGTLAELQLLFSYTNKLDFFTIFSIV